MPVFRYRAIQASGLVHKGQRSAAHEKELALMLWNSGLELIDAQIQKPARSFPFSVPVFRKNIKSLVPVCRQLANLLRTGLPFLNALKTIIGTLQPGPLHSKLDGISHTINQGSMVADAFALHPDLFNPIFIAILKTGEASGDLTATFEQLTKLLERQNQFAERIHRALRYPLFLIFLAFCVVSFMLTMVVPRVLDFLNTLSTSLPWSTRFLIQTASFVADYWWITLLTLLATASASVLGCRLSRDFACWLDRLLLSSPGLGTVLKKIALARFTYNFSLLLANGADLPSAFSVAKEVLGHPYLIALATVAQQNILSGKSLSSALGSLLPADIIQMIAVAEQSGSLGFSLQEISRTYDDEAQAALDQFIGSLEPALTLFVGALLGWVVLAVLGPVYSSLGQLSGGVP